MKTSKLKVLGIVLFAGAVLVALTMQLLGSGLITTRSLPVPPPIPGQSSIGSITQTTYHWQLLPLALIAIAGLICLLLPGRHDHAA